MVRDVVPEIEMVNNSQLHEPGFRYKEQIIQLRQKLNQVGTNEGDRALYEAQEDPNFNIDYKNIDYGEKDSDDEREKIEKKAKKIGDIMSQIKRNKEKSDLMFRDFEKNLGLKLKVLNEYENPDDEATNNPILDLDIYEKVMHNSFMYLQNKHSEVVSEIRNKQIDTVFKVRQSQQRFYDTD